jgi:hypothetical protein
MFRLSDLVPARHNSGVRPAMALRKSKTFVVLAYGLTALSLLSALAHIAHRALSGGWNETYVSAKLVSWSYGGAFIVVCGVALVGVAGFLLHIQRRWRNRN